MLHIISSLVPALLLGLFPLLATATVATRLSHQELATHSHVVAEGRVESMSCHLSPDGRRIVTTVRLRVEDAWKGAPQKTMEIQVPGGTADGISQVVQGMPEFREGEEVVVFLEKPGAEAPFRVVGLAQGKMTVRVDPELGKVAEPNLQGLELIDKGTGKIVRPLTQGPIPLAQLKAEVLATEGR